MATSGRGSGIVGYNVQCAVDMEHHRIVAHEVTNVGHDREQLSGMAGKAKAALGLETARGARRSRLLQGRGKPACAPIGVTPYVPKPLTSGAKRGGPVRQARLHLRAGKRHLSLSRR